MKKLAEYYGQRPDTSGNRGGLGRKPHQAGAEFPYDGEKPSYGSTDIRYGKGSKKSTPTTSGPNNDEPKFDEAIGIPFVIGRSADGGGGLTGGRVTPGTSGEWSNRPKGDGWDNRITDDEVERAGREHERYVREFIEETFVSLRATPEREKEDGTSPRDTVRVDSEADFSRLSDVLRRAMDDMEDHEIVSALFATDEDGFSKILGSVGKDTLLTIYGRWVDDTLGSDDDRLGAIVKKLSGDLEDETDV